MVSDFTDWFHRIWRFVEKMKFGTIADYVPSRYYKSRSSCRRFLIDRICEGRDLFETRGESNHRKLPWRVQNFSRQDLSRSDRKNWGQIRKLSEGVNVNARMGHSRRKKARREHVFFFSFGTKFNGHISSRVVSLRLLISLSSPIY